MKIIKKLAIAILGISIAIGASTCATKQEVQVRAAETLAHGECGENVTWSVSGSTLTISGNGAMEDYYLNGDKPWLDWKKSITKVVVNEGVTYIGEGAFTSLHNVTEVVLPNTVQSIGVDAFSGIAITAINIPAGVTEIPDGAFTYCSELKEVILPESIIRIGKNAFNMCSNLSKLQLPAGLKEIGEYAFSECSLLTGELEINSIVSMGDRAFEACGFSSLKITSNLDSIPIAAFYGCESIETIVLNGKIKSIGALAFYSNKSLKKIEIPDGVTEINESAFGACSNLEEIIIPKSVVSIEDNAFASYPYTRAKIYGYENSYADEFTFANKLSFVYLDKTNAEGIHIEEDSMSIEVGKEYQIDYSVEPSSVDQKDIIWESTEDWLHVSDGKIYADEVGFGYIIARTRNGDAEDDIRIDVLGEKEEEDFPKPGITNGECGDHVKWELSEDGKTLYISGTGEMEDYPAIDMAPWADDNYRFKNVIIGEGITRIGDAAFYSKETLESISFPDTLKEIGYMAFEHCRNLKNVKIPEAVNVMELYAFSHCASLEEVSIPKGVKTLETGCFWNCESLKNITLQEGLESIEKDAFTGCYYLEEIHIPKSVVSIGEDALENNILIWGYANSYVDRYALEQHIPFQYIDKTNVESIKIDNASIMMMVGDKYKLDVSVSPANVDQNDIAWISEEGKVHFENGYIYADKVGYDYIRIEGRNHIGDSFGLNVKCIPEVKNGKCGNNLEWQLSEDGYTLYISGTGNMYDYMSDTGAEVSDNEDFYSKAPWADENYFFNKVVVNAGVTSIGSAAFFQNNNLEEISLPDTLKSIHDSAFRYCERLKTVNIPSSVTSIERNAFRVCNSLSSITIPNGVKKISAGCFGGCYELESLKLPEGLIDIEDNAFLRCYELKCVEIPDSVETIGARAFERCYKLNSVTIPDSVKSIGRRAFFSTFKLNKVLISKNVQYIGEEALGFTDEDGEGPYVKENFTLMGYHDSKAEAYANVYGIAFISVDPEEEPEHVHSEITINAVKESCTSAGYTGDIKCSDCGEIIKEGTIIPAKGHEWDSEPVIDKEASCDKDGSQSIHCKNCDETKDIEMIPKLGHIWNDGSVTKKASCTSAGEITYKCNTCGNKRIEKTSVTEHTYQWVTVKASLTTNGYKAQKCSSCEKIKDKTIIYYPKTFTLSKTSFTYTGKVQKPVLTVKGFDGKVIPASNYTSTIPSGIKVGSYTVKIVFKGDYSGSKSFIFKILPKATTIKKLTPAKKSFTVAWNKQTGGTPGYQIQYATNSKFTSAKTLTIKKNTTVSTKITKLLSKKKYYVRIRTYKGALYSAWSVSKTVTTK